MSVKVRQLPPGPFTITPLHCGAYTAAERDKFGTTAKGGLVFKYTNVSNSVTGSANLEVDFLQGSTVVGDNVTGSAPQVSPGQSAEGNVDALDQGGDGVAFSTCELLDYALPGQADAYAP